MADPGPFTPTFLEPEGGGVAEVVAISVDDDAVAALGLAAGSWWTAWSDGVSCRRAVALFDVEAP